MQGLNPASGRTLSDLPRSHKRAFATISTVITPVIITCSSFHLFTECRIILRPLTVHFRFKLWLPILGNYAQYCAVLHFPFSSHGSRPIQWDFNQRSPMLSLTQYHPLQMYGCAIFI